MNKKTVCYKSDSAFLSKDIQDEIDFMLMEDNAKRDRKKKINNIFFIISSIIIFIFPIISIMIIKIDDFGDTAFVFVGLFSFFTQLLRF